MADDRENTPLLKDEGPPKTEDAKSSKGLLISFIAMCFFGLGNKIFQVLQFQPMYNYPLFVNMFSTFVYLPTSFSYIFAMIQWGKQITPEARSVPKKVFAVMGFLDSTAGVMQSLAVNFLANGSTVILLQQAAIPFSMLISYLGLKTKYRPSQYIGAITVMVGLVAAMVPSFELDCTTLDTEQLCAEWNSCKWVKTTDICETSKGTNTFLWAAVMIVSCIPMCLSSVYKEKALGDVDLDPVFMNGWIALFQFFFAFPLLIPAGYTSGVDPKQLPSNLWGGMKCMAGVNTIMTGDHADNCAMGPAFVSTYVTFNLGYNVLILLILKYGSSNILWLAMTLMVPLSDFAFMLKFMPGHKALSPWNVVGLVLIMVGLCAYRFWTKFRRRYLKGAKKIDDSDDEDPKVVNAAPATPGTPGTPAGASTPMMGGGGGIAAHRARRKKHYKAAPQLIVRRGSGPNSQMNTSINFSPPTHA